MTTLDSIEPRSYATGTSGTPLLGETIGENLRRTALRWGDRPALISLPQEIRWTYGEFDHLVDRLASGLIAAGVERGDRIALWAPNCAEWTLVQYATARIGAIQVNINPAYSSSELSYVLRQSGTKALIAAPSFKGADYRKMAGEVRPDCPALESVIVLGEPEWDSLAATQVDATALADRAAALNFDDAINIQYTSGTTGAPKGATLSHHNILNNAFLCGGLLGYSELDRICIPVPFYHCFGMVMGNLAATTRGATMVIPAPSFEPIATLAAVEAEGCTALYGVPTMFIAELEDPRFPEFDLGSLRTGIMAGSICPPEVTRRVIGEMHMPEFVIAYGMTETSPVSTQTRCDDELDLRLDSVGRPVPHVEVRIADPATGLTVPTGEPGELCTRGYSVMLGYWEDPERTEEAIDEAGWMRTGDFATMDEYGCCRIVGRIKDMVIRGGENISPREIEDFLYGHPDIAEAQVIGVPDPRFGEEVCAWVRLRDGASLTEDELLEHCRGQLAHFKTPRYVLFVEEFPMTVTGKVQKFRMREIAVERLGLSEEPAVVLESDRAAS